LSGDSSVSIVRQGKMPKIPTHVTNAVFYLFHSVADAETGHDPQGTGFFVRHLHNGLNYTCGVTNWHVATKGRDVNEPPSPVIRYVGHTTGEMHIISRDEGDWLFFQDGGDIAFTVVNKSEDINITAIPSSEFLTKDDIEDLVGVGEALF
jgi:hypothetical protein